MRKDIYADLHNHTTASDGDLSPEELVRRMKALGVAVVGVTDHDTDSGLDLAVAEGKKIGVQVVPGVEISVRFKEDFFTGTLHLLCYFNPELLANAEFRQSLETTLAKGRGDELVRARVSEINNFFGPEHNSSPDKKSPCNQSDCKDPILKRELTFEEVISYSSKVTRRHFSLALSEKHNIRNPDVINKIIGNQSPAYLPSGIDLQSVEKFYQNIKNITRKFSPLMVLAHPAAGSFPYEGHYKEVHPPIEIVEKLLPRFIDAGIRGIEINYPGHIEAHREILRGWAAAHDLVATGGSDCHDIFVRPPGVEGITSEEFKKLLL